MEPEISTPTNVPPKQQLDLIQPKPVSTLPPTRDGSLCAHFENIEKKDFHFTESLPIELTTFIHQFFGDSSDFFAELHKKENYKGRTKKKRKKKFVLT